MKIAFVVFDGMTALDFVGAFDPLTRLRTMRIDTGVEWEVVGISDEVTSHAGLRVGVTIVGESLADYDLLVVPGGYATRTLSEDSGFKRWLRTSEAVPLKASICTGALLLGAVGFLEGRRATTHPAALEELERYCRTVVRQRVVDEGDVVTSGGVTAAIDVGLHLCGRLGGPDARSRIARQIDWPHDVSGGQGA